MVFHGCIDDAGIGVGIKRFFSSGHQRKVERWLGYSGLIPFAYALLELPLPSSVTSTSLFITYSAIILAFMAGTIWRSHSVNTSVLSNVIALVAFAVLLLPLALSLALIILGLSYIGLLIWEYRECRSDYPSWYWHLRWQLTAAVVAAHLLMFVKVST